MESTVRKSRILTILMDTIQHTDKNDLFLEVLLTIQFLNFCWSIGEVSTTEINGGDFDSYWISIGFWLKAERKMRLRQPFRNGVFFFFVGGQFQTLSWYGSEIAGRRASVRKPTNEKPEI